MLKELLSKFSGNNNNITAMLNMAGTLQSLDPPETLFGFTYHGHCVPPFKPEHTLILGYGKGAIAELMRKVWGNDCKITGVDIRPFDYKYNEYKIETCDAHNFVKACSDINIKKRFDYIVLDVFDTYRNVMPDFLFEAAFVMRLREICTRLLCVNVFLNDVKKMRAYYDYGFKFERNSNVYGNSVIYWSVKK